MKDHDITRLKCTERRMVRLTCGASPNVRPGGVKSCSLHDELRDNMGLEYISVVMQRGRLRRFGHVERMGNGNWV